MARSSCSCRQDRQEQYRFNIMPLETVLSSILSFGLAVKDHINGSCSSRLAFFRADNRDLAPRLMAMRVPFPGRPRKAETENLQCRTVSNCERDEEMT